MFYLVNTIQHNNEFQLTDIILLVKEIYNIPIEYITNIKLSDEEDKLIDIQYYVNISGYCRYSSNDKFITIVNSQEQFHYYSEIDKIIHLQHINHIHNIERMNTIKHILT